MIRGFSLTRYDEHSLTVVDNNNNSHESERVDDQLPIFNVNMDIINLNHLYCRLCADLKSSSDLSNMGINVEKRRELIKKLSRFNIQVDFNNKLPKTVCIECINSLEHAYDFVTTVDLAQEAFQDYEHDNSAVDNRKDEVVSDDDNMITSNKDDSVKTRDTILDDKSKVIGKEIDVEFDPKTEVKETSSKSKSKKGITKLKPTMNQINRKRKKPKISANVDLDTWHDYNWLCAFCDKFFQNPSELKVHSMQYHMTCNPYRCFDCRARGLHMDNFITHITRHRPVLTLTCYQCSLQVETLFEKNKHKATHFNTDYVCCGCNSTFSSEEELDGHMKKFYKNAVQSSSVVEKNESLKCVLCEKTPKSRLLLHRHLLVHTDRKRTFICNTCGRGFYNRKELMQHQFVHTDERPYRCEVCNFSFKIKHELKKHAARHFEPKRFACDQCGKCFRLSKELMVHSAVHKDIRPFKCTYCNKTFRFRHLLMQHLRLHTGLKPYSCDNCPLTFRNWSNYNKHTKDVHGVDNAKRKRTSDGLYSVHPETKEIIYPDKDKVLEWKKKILGDICERPTKRSDEDESKEQFADDTESDG